VDRKILNRFIQWIKDTNKDWNIDSMMINGDSYSMSKADESTGWGIRITFFKIHKG